MFELSLNESITLGPNEISIRHIDAIVPMMGPKGLPKGPCAYSTLSVIVKTF